MNSTQIKAETLDLLAQYQNASDEAIRSDIENDILILNESFCQWMVYKHRHFKIDKDDAMQTARIGMLRAVRRFQFGKGAAFSTFAGHIIYKDFAKEIRFNQAAMRAEVPVSLDKNTIEDLTLQDILSDGIDMEQECIDKEFLRVVLSDVESFLPGEEYVALLHFLEIPKESLNQKELSLVLGVTQVQVSRYKNRAVNKVRERFGASLRMEVELVGR